MKNERQIVSRLKKILGSQKHGVKVGIGDDAAVLLPDARRLVVTVDCVVENTHFDLSYMTPEEVGWKALAVNLSDIAAMGALPESVVVSVGLPGERADELLPGLYKGIRKIANRYGVDVVGGNLSRSATFFVDVTALGRGTAPLLRSGAKAGDWVGYFGKLGEAAAGYEVLKRLGRKRAFKKWPTLCRAQMVPTPQTERGISLGKIPGVNALIDVSDGLVSELGHLSHASKVEMEIETARISLSKPLQEAAMFLKRDPLELALYGGEDYALLFTASPKAWPTLQKQGAQWLGKVKKGKGIWAVAPGARWPLKAKGFDHFQRQGERFS